MDRKGTVMELDEILNAEPEFRYRMLSRMKSDCEYYLGYGGRSANHLWALDEAKQIEYMKAIWNSFPEGQKPEWLSMEQIEEYGNKMGAAPARNVRALLIPVHDAPHEVSVSVSDSLNELQQHVGGLIEPLDVLGNGVCLYVNEEGIGTLPPNRALYATKEMEEAGFLSQLDFKHVAKEGELYTVLFGNIVAVAYDGIPFGFNYGTIFSEYTHLDDLNLLAKQMELRPDAVERVQEVLDTGCDAPENIIELMNLVEQADEIPFYSYEYSYMFNKDSWGQTCLERMSNEENYGYTLLEGTPLMELLEQNSEAMSAFDVGEYGRQCAENSYVSLSDHGYLDNSQDMPDLDYYCREELVEMIAGEWDKEHESDVSQEQGYSLSSEQRDMSKAKDALANEGRDMEQMRATDAR